MAVELNDIFSRIRPWGGHVGEKAYIESFICRAQDAPVDEPPFLDGPFYAEALQSYLKRFRAAQAYYADAAFALRGRYGGYCV